MLSPVFETSTVTNFSQYYLINHFICIRNKSEYIVNKLSTFISVVYLKIQCSVSWLWLPIIQTQIFFLCIPRLVISLTLGCFSFTCILVACTVHCIINEHNVFWRNLFDSFVVFLYVRKNCQKASKLRYAILHQIVNAIYLIVHVQMYAFQFQTHFYWIKTLTKLQSNLYRSSSKLIGVLNVRVTNIKHSLTVR